MNKLIKELAVKTDAWCDQNHFGKSDYDLQWEAKFAELIVEECMATVLKESKWYWDKAEFESSNAIQNAARRVKEHFGVKE